MGTASTLAINPAAYKSLPYDIIDDLEPIGLIARCRMSSPVNPSVPAKTVAELVALAKAQPGKLTYGSAGNGSVSHLMGEQFKLATGTDIIHVPYRGVGPALNDAVGGQIQIMFDNLPTSLPLIQDGKLRALAVSSPQASRRAAGCADLRRTWSSTDLDWMAFFGLSRRRRRPQAGDRPAECGASTGAGDARRCARRCRSSRRVVQPGAPGDFEALIYRNSSA